MDWDPHVTSCLVAIVWCSYRPQDAARGSQQLAPRQYQEERLLSLKGKALQYRLSIIHIPRKKQKTPDAHSRKPTDDAKNFPWIAISRRRTPLLVLNRVSIYLRPS